jgi:hypothetical protein
MMPITALWLPILLSAVIVFVMSSIIHMASPWHKNDYPRMPREDEAMDALRPLAIPPGDYMVPRVSSRAEMTSPEFAEKLRRGPLMIVTMLPNGPFSMRRNLGLWFGYLVVVSTFAACLTSRVLGAGTEYMSVFKFVAPIAFLGYTAALWQMWIWYHRSLTITVKATIDGLLYALLTAGTFGWLWPR